MEKFSFIGKDMKRIDALSKATGETLFAADLSLPRMLVGKILRSPHAHARVIGIDTSKAERLPGVKAIVTAKRHMRRQMGCFSIHAGPAVSSHRKGPLRRRRSGSLLLPWMKTRHSRPSRLLMSLTRYCLQFIL